MGDTVETAMLDCAENESFRTSSHKHTHTHTYTHTHTHTHTHTDGRHMIWNKRQTLGGMACISNRWLVHSDVISQMCFSQRAHGRKHLKTPLIVLQMHHNIC